MANGDVSSEFAAFDSIDGAQSLHAFLNQALDAAEQSRTPDTDATIVAIMETAYTRDDGWCAVQVSDRYGRDVELAAPHYEALYDSVKRFFLR